MGGRRRAIPRSTPLGYMTSGEKMIWAAAYESEYRRWTQGRDPVDRRVEPYQAAKFALAYAAGVVTSARMAVDDQRLENAVHQAFLRTMVDHPKLLKEQHGPAETKERA